MADVLESNAMKTVVLPAPLGPKSPTISPSFTLILISLRVSFYKKNLDYLLKQFISLTSFV